MVASSGCYLDLWCGGGQSTRDLRATVLRQQLVGGSAVIVGFVFELKVKADASLGGEYKS